MTKKIEETISALAKRVTQLDIQRRTARGTLDRAIQARQDALLVADEIDEAKLARLQRVVNDAASLLEGIEQAIATIAEQKAEAEAQLAAERDSSEREAAAQALDVQVAAIKGKLPKWLAASREFTDALTAVARLRHYETGEISAHVQNLAGQVEIACNLVLAELQALPDMIRNGNAPIPREERPAPIVAAAVPPPTMTVFMMRSARFRDHDGRKRFGGQYEDVIMPLTTAQKAMRLGVAVATTDTRRAALRGSRGGDFRPDAADVLDIDEAAERSGPEHAAHDTSDVMRQANFVQVDRGPERKGVISVQRLI